MEGYILIVLQVLLSGLIIWRIRQQNHGKAGCFAVFMTIAVVFALTTSLYFLGKSIVFDGLLSDVFADSRGSLAAASPAEWLMAGFLLLMIILIVATVCSMTGFAITGHHPHFCKMVWKTLAGILLLPIIAMALLGISFATAFVVCMRIASPMFDYIGWGWMIMLVLMGIMCLFGFSGFVTLLMNMNRNDIKQYDIENRERTFRRITDNGEKGGEK